MPILARPATFRYRAGKLIRRHKGVTVTAALLVLSLVAGMTATLWEAHLDRLDRDHAERRFQDVRRLANSILFEMHDAIEPLAGATAARELLVKRAREFLDSLAREPGRDTALRRELAAAYQRLGRVQGQGGAANLGHTADAIDSFRQAVKLREQVAAENPKNLADQRLLASAYDGLAIALSGTGDWKSVDEYDNKALAVRKAVAAQLPEQEKDKVLELSYYYVGLHSGIRGDYTRSLESYRNYLRARELIAQEQRAPAAFRASQSNLALAHKRIAALLVLKKEYADALEHYRAAQMIDEKLVRSYPNDAETRMDLTFEISDIAYIEGEQGHLTAALADYQQAEAIRSELSAADPKNQRAQGSLAETESRIADILRRMGRRQSAVASAQKALALREVLAANDAKDLRRQVDLARSCRDFAQYYATLAADSRGAVGDRLVLWRRARDFYRRAEQIIREVKSRGLATDPNLPSEQRIAEGLAKSEQAIAQLSKH